MSEEEESIDVNRDFFSIAGGARSSLWEYFLACDVQSMRLCTLHCSE
jgi:hypothetical protein